VQVVVIELDAGSAGPLGSADWDVCSYSLSQLSVQAHLPSPCLTNFECQSFGQAQSKFSDSPCSGNECRDISCRTAFPA